MQQLASRFYSALDRSLPARTRVLLALLFVPLLLSFTVPIWRISMVAPQYPDGLHLDIYVYKLVGGNDGEHIDEINTLNHYIGMHKIDRAAMADLDWIPFALGAMALLLLRCATVGNGRSLCDLTAITGYVLLFAFARFAYRLYLFGHELSPDAPVKVAPFMPVLLGSKQVANFTTSSYPLLGTLFIGLVVAGLALGLAWQWRPSPTAAPGSVARAKKFLAPS